MAALTQNLGSVVVVGTVVAGCWVVVAFDYVERENWAWVVMVFL
jgi:hypothetical protein